MSLSRIGIPALYISNHSVCRFTQANSFGRSASMIFVLSDPLRVACSSFPMASIANKPFLPTLVIRCQEVRDSRYPVCLQLVIYFIDNLG